MNQDQIWGHVRHIAGGIAYAFLLPVLTQVAAHPAEIATVFPNLKSFLPQLIPIITIVLVHLKSHAANGTDPGTADLSAPPRQATQVSQFDPRKQGSARLSVLFLLGTFCLGIVGCAWIQKQLPNSPERTAKIASDAVLQEIGTGETNFAVAWVAKWNAASATNGITVLSNLTVQRRQFDTYVGEFQSAYVAALDAYLAVKPAGTNQVTASALLQFSAGTNSFAPAYSNLLQFIHLATGK